jgi:hypothetical protein
VARRKSRCAPGSGTWTRQRRRRRRRCLAPGRGTRPPTPRRGRRAAAAGRRTGRHGARCCHDHRDRRHAAGCSWLAARRRSGRAASIARHALASPDVSDRETAARWRKNPSFSVAARINERSEAWSGENPEISVGNGEIWCVPGSKCRKTAVSGEKTGS